jgi:hypothetical protein
MARELRSRTYLWMGAGTLALGIGAALAGGSGVAQADSTSSSSPGPAKPGHHQAAAAPSRTAASSVKSAKTKSAGAHRVATQPGIVSTAVALHVAKTEKSTAAADNPLTEQAQAIAAQQAVITQEQQVVRQEVQTVLGNFTTSSPVINAAHLYSGAGSASLVAAAASWNGLAAQLNSAAVSLQFVTSLGPVPSALAQPALTWLTTTAGQSEAMAVQASTAADVYQAAFTATVPPAVLAANRGLLNTLIATNFLGINTPMIAATEAEYLALWAQGGFRPFSSTPVGV